MSATAALGDMDSGPLEDRLLGQVAMQKQLEQLEAALDELDNLAPTGPSALPPLSAAQAHLANLDIALTLARSLHGLHGERPLPEALEPETRMLSAYGGKVARALARVELASHKRTLEINVDAAHRFIDHAVGLDEDTRAKLCKVAEDKAAARATEGPKVSRLAVLSKSKHANVEAAKGISAADRVKAQLERRRKEKPKDATERILKMLDD